MNYHLAPSVTVSEIIHEVQLSLANLFHRAKSYGIDRDRLYVGGFSAGGLLAARMLMTDWTTFGINKPVMQQEMALSGIFDPEPLISTSHNQVLNLTPLEARELNVISSDPNAASLALLACGTAETGAFKKQTTGYLKPARKKCASSRQLWIEDRHHYDVILELAQPDSVLSMVTRQMIAGRSKT